MNYFCRTFFILASLSLLQKEAIAQTPIADTLLSGFRTPPGSALPRVWWHWMNGNITQEGIKKDLFWMKRVGIGGFHNFDAAWSTPQIVKKRLAYMTPDWKAAMHYTAKLADSLHLEMAIAGSPGWSESGGPWVLPKDGMKKIVWTETQVTGGKPFTGKLSALPVVTGPFQDIVGGDNPKVSSFKDIAVLAYKVSEADFLLSSLKPVITSSGGKFTLAQLTDGNLAASVTLPAETGNKPSWIQYDFQKVQTIKALSIVGGNDRGYWGPDGQKEQNRSLETSSDGVNFQLVCYLPSGTVAQQTITFAPVSSRFFRISFKSPPPPAPVPAGTAPATVKGIDIAEIVLHGTVRVNRFEEKDAFSTATDLYQQVTPITSDTIPLTAIINLTDKVSTDGSLNWTPPAGSWNIVRFGYSLLGITNHPASPEATGLEVDKLDPVAVKAYFTNYLDQYKDATQGLMGSNGGIQYIVTDSWEAGTENWTGDLPAQFLKRRGYSLLPWMPVLAGHVVRGSAESDQFLWDYRKTLSELVAEYHYDLLTTLLHERGIKRYSESHEFGRAYIADGMDVKRTADIPMSAMWTPSVFSTPDKYRADIRESASVAHIYGQNLVAAESMTAFGPGGHAWSYYPENLKPTADLELASGLNRFVIHCSVHQPTDDKLPGLGLGPFGQWFNRHETWAEQAKVWTAYLARSSYLLQQGKFVADVVYYYGEDSNITSLFDDNLPEIPAGYNYDFINSDALLNLLSVSNHRLVTPSGMSYKLLSLDSNSRYMPLKVLRKIAALVEAGASVSGPKPVGSPGLGDDKAEYAKLVNLLWGADGTVRDLDGGKVFSGLSVGKALTLSGIEPDFQSDKTGENAKVLYVHRSLRNKEIYWINNRSDSAQNLDASFRLAGKTVEIWDPETGKSRPASYSAAGGRTSVPLKLAPHDALFIVFGKSTTLASRTIREPAESVLTTLAGPWKVSFQKDRGAPESASVSKLSSWSESADKGVKYFSGTGTYSRQFNASASWLKKGSKTWIDLGDVKNIAEVVVNGKSMGITWKKPYRVELTGALKQGDNTLVIKVTNLWVNRLIGDEQPGAKRYTFTTERFYEAGSPLQPSGLLGPVKILAVH